MVAFSETLPEIRGPSVSAMRVFAAAAPASNTSRTATTPASPGQWRLRSIAPGSWQTSRALSSLVSGRQDDAPRLALRAAVIGHEGGHQRDRDELLGAQGLAPRTG